MPSMPTRGIAESVRTAVEVHTDLEAREKRHHLDVTPTPELGLIPPMFAWASGQSLRQSLEDSPLAAGDFVRWARQCIDVLDQLGRAPHTAAKLAARCREAVDLIGRGVVAYSTVSPAPQPEAGSTGDGHVATDSDQDDDADGFSGEGDDERD